MLQVVSRLEISKANLANKATESQRKVASDAARQCN